MSIYAILYLILIIIGALISTNQHGKLKPIETYNFWYSVALSIPGWILLYMGGFFKLS